MLVEDSSGKKVDMEALVRYYVEDAMREFTALVKQDIAACVENDLMDAVKRLQGEVSSLYPALRESSERLDMLEAKAAEVESIVVPLQEEHKLHASRIFSMEAEAERFEFERSVTLNSGQVTSVVQPAEVDEKNVLEMQQALSLREQNLQMLRESMATLDFKHKVLSDQVKEASGDAPQRHSISRSVAAPIGLVQSPAWNMPGSQTPGSTLSVQPTGLSQQLSQVSAPVQVGVSISGATQGFSRELASSRILQGSVSDGIVGFESSQQAVPISSPLPTWQRDLPLSSGTMLPSPGVARPVGSALSIPSTTPPPGGGSIFHDVKVGSMQVPPAVLANERYVQ